MNSLYARLSAAALIVQVVLCFKTSLFSRNKPSQRSFLSPLRAGPATTSWSYKTLPEDFIVIEDRVLECYGQNTSTQADLLLDPNVPDMAYTELATVLGEEQLQKLIDLSQVSQVSQSGLESITLKIVPALSKEERTKFHQNVRQIYSTVDSKTELKDKYNTEDSTFILIYPKGAKSLVSGDSNRDDNYGYDENYRNSGAGNRKKVVVQRWDRSKSDYLHFTVIKSMLSTSEMMDRLAKMTSMLPTRFEFCGSKDKRALTMQRVSSWRVDQHAVQRVSTESMLVRDVCIASSPLHLGDLSGNFFAITLRREPGSNTQNNLQINENINAFDLMNSFTDITSFPFMNIFGIQRFGAPLPSNPEVGKRLLRSDYRGAVLMLLLAPSTEIELKIGGLDLTLLNSWLNTAQKMEDRENYDSSGNKIIHEKSSGVYFKYLSGRFEEYMRVIDQAVVDGKFDENVVKVEEEKMGDEWNAMINAEEKNDPVKRESDVYEYDARDNRELFAEDEPAAEEQQSNNNQQKSNKRQNNSKKDLKERLITLNELLKGRPFDIPKATSFLQKKIFNQFYEEMSRKCEGDLSRINFSRVFSVLPPAMRQLFVNSYQSLLWNSVAIERINNNVHNVQNNIQNTNNKHNINHNDDNKNVDIKNEDNSENSGTADLTNNSENPYTKNSVIELKALLKERKQKVSGKKEDLIARLIESDGMLSVNKGENKEENKEENMVGNTNNGNKNNDIDFDSFINDCNNTNNDNSNIININNNNNNNINIKGFLSSDTAVVGDTVLVSPLTKTPLTAWHVAAQNISLNGNHIPLWSVDVLDPKPVAMSVGVEGLVGVGGVEGGMGMGGQVINSNTPFNANPNSAFFKDPNDRGIGGDRFGGGGDRDSRGSGRGGDRGGRGGRGGDRGGRNGGYDEVVEEEVREIKACYHVITAEDEALRSYPIESVIVALPGASVYVTPGGVAMKRVTQDKMTVLLTGTHHDKIFRLAGAYRHLVTVAKNVRIAPVRTSKNELINENEFTEKNQNSVTVEIPKWAKIVVKSSEQLPSALFDYPFSGQVEKLWDNGIIPKLLFDIYSGSSGATMAKNIGVLPSGLINTIEADRPILAEPVEIEIDGNGKKIAGKGKKIEETKGIEGIESREDDVAGVRISFSLCASTYATTFLDHLTETINKKSNI